MHMEVFDQSYQMNDQFLTPSLDTDCGVQYSPVVYADADYDSGNCSPANSPLKESYNRTNSCSSFGSDSLHSSGFSSACSDMLYPSSCSGSDLMYNSPVSVSPSPFYDRKISTSSYGSDGHDSNSTDNFDLSSFSSLSISSEESLLSNDSSQKCARAAPSSAKNSRPRQRKLATQCNKGVPRRSSAPVNRKDSFVYDVQMDKDNVLLFVPDLELVKSHLMVAVREEVDVLKEKIGTLMDRISNLEYENTILRQHATPETLQQLHQSAS